MFLESLPDVETYHWCRRVCLKDLKLSNPDLVNQTHVFSSFFYKNLAAKKYAIALILFDSSHSWLGRMAVIKVSPGGQKRLIFSERNTLSYLLMSSTFSLSLRSAVIHKDSKHWYLAIIYEPEHVLRGSLVDNHKSLFTTQTTSGIPSLTVGRPDSLETHMEYLNLVSEIKLKRNQDSQENTRAQHLYETSSQVSETGATLAEIIPK